MKTLILLLLIPILISGQTVTEKIKAKFKQIEKAKQERLKECEDINDKRDSTWYEKGMSATDYYRSGITSNRINYTIAELPEASFIFAKDSARVTVSGYTYKTDLGIYQTMVLATIVQLWDEYAKECYADSALTHTYTPKWNSGCLRQTGNLAEGYSFIIDCKDSSHYSYTHKQPDPIGFIEFLRNKLGEK